MCYHFFVVNRHIAPDCDLQLHEMDKVVANYEALSPINPELVPKAVYIMAKHFIKVNGPPSYSNQPTEGSSSPKN